MLQNCTLNLGIDPEGKQVFSGNISLVMVNAGKLELTRLLLSTKHLHNPSWMLDDISIPRAMYLPIQGSDAL